jgi:hypothetical protein
MGELPGDWRGDNSALPGYHVLVKGNATPIPPELMPYTSTPPVELPADHGFSELNSPHGNAELPFNYKRFSWER